MKASKVKRSKAATLSTKASVIETRLKKSGKTTRLKGHALTSTSRNQAKRDARNKK